MQRRQCSLHLFRIASFLILFCCVYYLLTLCVHVSGVTLFLIQINYFRAFYLNFYITDVSIAIIWCTLSLPLCSLYLCLLIICMCLYYFLTIHFVVYIFLSFFLYIYCIYVHICIPLVGYIRMNLCLYCISLNRGKSLYFLPGPIRPGL